MNGRRAEYLFENLRRGLMSALCCSTYLMVGFASGTELRQLVTVFFNRPLARGEQAVRLQKQKSRPFKDGFFVKREMITSSLQLSEPLQVRQP